MSKTRWLAALIVSSGLVPLSCGNKPLPLTPLPRVVLSPEAQAESWQQARGLLESRCVVCHGCYDAPCQLKLGSFAGIERGASEHLVYDGARLLAADPTRLGIDARDVAGWRKKEFHPVLPEGAMRLEQSPLLRMLALKREHPLPPGGDLSRQFTLDLDREQTCSSAENFDAYAREHPMWGMPYGLPGLDVQQQRTLETWVQAGSPHLPPPAAKPQTAAQIQAWESFLNEPSNKGKLSARYIYEHLFLASVRFEGDAQQMFRLVRSRTPPGSPVDEIATRRPFGEPRTLRPYYRFVLRDERPLDKTYMPYELGAERLSRYRSWFLDSPYQVATLPGYDSEESANPFAVFDAIPVSVRYRFMLEEAQFTMMGFIKGPVCRGQAALNVIRDRFWVVFLKPDAGWMNDESHFLAGVQQDLELPAAEGSNARPSTWFGLASRHSDYMKARWAYFAKLTRGGELVQTDLIWDGDGKNQNAALTVFRHLDSATVVKGLVGGTPKTAWVLNYPILERIHYLLVAGFDVFGNVGHQLTTRLYMDFLREEAESVFMAFLPPARRVVLGDFWYRGVTGEAKRHVSKILQGADLPPNIQYTTREPERELLALIEQRLEPVRARELDIDRAAPEDRAILHELDDQWGPAVAELPETSFVTVLGASGRAHYTILRDSARTNVNSLFDEGETRVREEDELSVMPGFVGAYPNALFELPRQQLPAFVAAIAKLRNQDDYRALRQRYGVLRSSPRFWAHSDQLQADRERLGGEALGLLDYNRLGGL